MSKTITFVGLEVDDNAFHAALINAETGEVDEFRCRPQLAALIKRLEQFSAASELRICYEASYVGFSICRQLREKGFSCVVIAPSLTPQSPGAKVKTDRLDAAKLARFYLGGLLTVVNVPDEQDEDVRDLIRSRHFVLGQLKANKLRLVSTCRRAGMDYRQDAQKPTAKYWTKHHRLCPACRDRNPGRDQRPESSSGVRSRGSRGESLHARGRRFHRAGSGDMTSITRCHPTSRGLV